MLTRYFPSCALLAITVWSIPTQAQTGTPVLTGQYDNARTGANLNESVLNTSNVNPSSFGKLYAFPVDGDVIAQPLYWPGRQMNGTTVNLLYVATAHNTVYAFDADDATKPPIWQVSLGPSVPGVSGNCPSQGFTGAELGILSTPVIDPTTATIYLTSATPATAPATGYIYRMIALDALTGQHKFGSPNTITASVPGMGYDAVSRTVSINTHTAMQRAALLLTNGTVYAGFASCGPDRDPYHGWILGYSATNVQTQTLVFNASPNGQRAGIWQSGRGLVADSSGAVYAMTGNGTWNGTDATMTEFGNSFIKLNGGSVVDWFTPTDWDALNTYDLDLGSSGPILLPQPQLLVGGGKEGVLYALDLASLGHLGGSLQSFQASTACGTFSFNQCHQIRSIAFWDDVQNPLLYIWATGDNLRAYRLTGRQFITTPDTQYPNLNSAPVMLSVSALRGTAGTGIVWALARSSNGTGTLYAFDAANVARQLYSSATNSARDSLGTGPRLAHFTIADGKVFVPTFSRQVVVYGIVSPPTLTSIAVTPANPTVQAGASQQFRATGTYSDNSTKDITSQVTWSSSNTAVASINAAGLASALAAGTTTISAVQGGITGTTTLTVQAPPAVSTATLPNGTGGVPYSATLTATGGTPPYTWSITSGTLPAGLSLNATTGSIAGTPTIAGVSTFTIQVTDSFSPAGTAVRNLSITIAQPSADTGFLPPTANAPVKVGAGDNNGFETTPTNAYRSDGLFAVDANSGTTTSTSCTNTGKDKHDFFAYSFGLPKSAVIQGIEVRLDARVNSTANSPMMCVQLSWDGGATWTAPQTTPTLSTTTATYVVGGAANSWGRSWSGADFSNTNFRVRVIDVAAAITSTFSLDFLAVRITYQGSGPTLNAIAVTPANSTVAAGSVQQFTATGTYSDGSTVDITNNVTWTSSTATVATVNFSGSVTGVAVGNANISAAQGGIQGTTAVAVFGVSTTSLPTAIVGTAYSATLAAVNGTTPYTWAMVSGALPSGLTLNPSGTVTGTPSVNGNFSFTVRVTDSGAPPLQATKTVSMMAVTNTGLLQPNADAPVTTGAGNNNGFETNPANAYVLDGLFAVDADSGTTTSALYTDTGKDRHDFFGYSFGLPSNALIRGIEVRLDAKADSTLNTPRIYVQLSWNGGTSWTAAQATPTLTTTTATYIVGGIVNVWGRTWVASDFSNTNFRVRVINVAGSTARTFSLDWLAVRVSYQESGPTITSIAVTPVNLTAQAGATQQFTATGTYSDNSTKDITSQVTWSSSSTAVASINAVGLATTVGAGTITISALQGGTTGTTTLTVQAPPSVSTATLPNGTVGVPYSATLSATGGTSPYSWSIASGALPVGLSLDATSGSISGTPSVAGVSTFTIQATDSSNPAATAIKDLSISILSPSTATGFLPPTANAPVKVGAGDNNGFETTPTNAYRSDGLFAVDTNSGTTTSTSCTNTGKDKHDFFAYSFGLPSTAVIQGIEVRLDARVNSAANSPMMCVQLSWDGGATWTAPQTTPTLSTTTATYLVGGAANSWGRSWSGADFSNTNFRVRVIDVAAAITSTFSLDGLAVRITYQGSGPTLNAIAVTPANSTVAAGSVQQFTATGTYSDGSTVDITNNVTWTSSTATVARVDFSGSVTGVAAGNANISAAQGGIQGTTTVGVFGVSTSSLPTATVGTAYSATLAAVNGTTPYTWAMVSGALPSGLTLNPSGTITGTPDVNGNFSFTVQVTDSTAPPLQATKTLSMIAVTNTGYLQPNADAPVTTGAGNNNGFETNPANAYVLDGLFAVDANSGTTTSTLYTDTGKDKHEFFTYNVTLPTGATIRGIEVQLNAKADSALNAPKIYVQLSWNGGTTWTTALGTATLTTTNAPYTLGGPATNWGRTWGTADVSNTNFRVRVINVASSTARTFSLDRIGVRITYW